MRAGRQETTATEETSSGETEDDVVNTTPEMRSSSSRQQAHTPDAYTSGYDPESETRIGTLSGTESTKIARLVRQHEGRHQSDGGHSAREAARDKKRVTQCFCSTLGVTAFQQQQAVAAMGRMNLDRFGHQKRLEKVALATIKVVVDHDRQQPFTDVSDLSAVPSELFPTRLIEDNSYLSLVSEYGIERGDLYSVSQLVKRELTKRGFFGGEPTDAHSE